jgi:glutathione S-transferase
MKLVIGNKAYSSWSMRPWVVMKAFGIPFEEALVQLRSPGTAADIGRHSPSGKVPALIDGDVTVWETTAIYEYLAEKYPQHSIWPKDATARAHARAVASEMHDGFQPLRAACPMDVTKRFAAKERSPDVMANLARITAIFREARSKFGGSGPFLYGGFSAADGMYAPVCTRLRTWSIAVDSQSQAYVDAVLGHPAVRAWYGEAAAEPWRLGEDGYAAETLIEDLRTTKA